MFKFALKSFAFFFHPTVGAVSKQNKQKYALDKIHYGTAVPFNSTMRNVTLGFKAVNHP